MNKRTIYRIGSAIFLISIVANLLVSGRNLSIGLAVLSLLSFLGLISIKCYNCGTRPILRIFWIWLVLIDFPLFIADVVFLNQCPKCRKDPFKKELAVSSE